MLTPSAGHTHTLTFPRQECSHPLVIVSSAPCNTSFRPAVSRLIVSGSRANPLHIEAADQGRKEGRERQLADCVTSLPRQWPNPGSVSVLCRRVSMLSHLELGAAGPRPRLLIIHTSLNSCQAYGIILVLVSYATMRGVKSSYSCFFPFPLWLILSLLKTSYVEVLMILVAVLVVLVAVGVLAAAKSGPLSHPPARRQNLGTSAAIPRYSLVNEKRGHHISS